MGELVSWKGILLVLFIGLSYVNCNFDPFGDTKLYSISWPGKLLTKNPSETGKDDIEKLSMITSNNEKYECLLPLTDNQKKSSNAGNSDAESPETLLSTLFTGKKSCTYRMEGYWSYELCHGRYLNQFHENSKGSYDHHFILGAYKNNKFPITPKDEKVPTKHIGNKDLPYYKLHMTDGTPCDLADGQPRQTSVYYICDENAKDEIIMLKEVVTCQYEVIVATYLLCKNSKYRPKEEIINQIYCHSVDDTPSIPKAELELKDSILKMQDSNILFDVLGKKGFPTASGISKPVTSKKIVESDLMKGFLKGTYCLNGGEGGWWKYEFCYGKSVKQYHEDQLTGKTIILLGSWDLDAHKEWFRNNKKDPTHKSTMELFFGNGDMCEATAQARKVVVRLRCRNDLATPNAIAMYLLEPTTCSYILVIESARICELLDSKDEFGIINSTPK